MVAIHRLDGTIRRATRRLRDIGVRRSSGRIADLRLTAAQLVLSDHRPLPWIPAAPPALLKMVSCALQQGVGPDEVCFLLIDAAGSVVGFAEAAIHQGPGGPYGHVEGWYVVPDHRGRG